MLTWAGVANLGHVLIVAGVAGHEVVSSPAQVVQSSLQAEGRVCSAGLWAAGMAGWQRTAGGG